MAYLIDRITEQLQKEGLTPRTNKARVWLRRKIDELKVSPNVIMKDPDRLRASYRLENTYIGKMFFYFYDPKHKKTLPYYDIFPLVIPIERYSDGFLGLNLHYIHPKQRLILLDKMSDFLNNSKYDATTRFRLTYETLKSASKIYEANPCLKRYLYAHIRSRFLEIPANEWDIAALLPTNSFEKASESKVFFDSRKKF